MKLKKAMQTPYCLQPNTKILASRVKRNLSSRKSKCSHYLSTWKVSLVFLFGEAFKIVFLLPGVRDWKHERQGEEMVLLSKGTRAEVGEPEGHWGWGCGEGRINQLLLSALTYFFELWDLSLPLLSATMTLPWGGSAANPHWMIAVPGIFLNVTRERHSLFPGGHTRYLWLSGHLVPFSHLPKIGHRWVTNLSTFPVWEAIDGGG